VEYVVGGESRGPTRWSTGAVEGREENGKQRKGIRKKKGERDKKEGCGWVPP
jgi:hypothetical protein